MCCLVCIIISIDKTAYKITSLFRIHVCLLFIQYLVLFLFNANIQCDKTSFLRNNKKQTPKFTWIISCNMVNPSRTCLNKTLLISY